MFFYVLGALALLLFVYSFFSKNSDFWKNKNVIYETGTLWEFMKGDITLAEVLKKVYDKHPDEPYVGIYLGAQPALLLRDLRNVEVVLKSEFQNFHDRGVFTNPNDRLADNILLMDNYPRWKLLRQKLSPLFKSASIKQMAYVIEICARDFVEKLKQLPEMREKCFNSVYLYSTASIGASAFGIDVHDGSTMDSPFKNMVWKILKPSFWTNIKFAITSFSPYLALLLNLKIFGEFESFFFGIMKNVLTLRRRNNDKRNDFMDMCMELQKAGVMRDSVTGYKIEPTDEVLAAQAFMLFLAGTDTSATALHFALLELSFNPDILSKVHTEIDKVFDECNDKVTYSDVEKLTFMDQVINEAMRKYPPIGVLQRKCTKDTVLPVGNIKVEKDVMVIIPVYAIQRDEENYQDADKFDPDRFSPERMSEIKKSSYIPFGDGNRSCLGIKVARIQVKLGMAWLLREFTLQAQKSTEMRFEKSPFAVRAPDANYILLKRNK